MARINLVRHVAAPASVGALHALAEFLDEKQGWTSPASAGFVFDVGGPILGGVAYSMDMMPEFTEPLLMCGMTLMTGRVIDWARSSMAPTAAGVRRGARKLVSRYPAPPFKETSPTEPRLI